ncbi:MAG: IS1 family transposase [Chthoniobacterales bacterium]
MDYSQIVKEYSAPVKEERRKYSPAKLVSVYKTAVNGDPIANLASTSMIERANLTLRTHCKRLARLTLSFSKKKENFQAAIALHLAYYNFVKTHGTIRCTPAMEAGIETSAWTVQDLVDAAS